jgi:hypothetical protein
MHLHCGLGGTEGRSRENRQAQIFAAYVFYGLAVLFPTTYWLGTGSVLFGFGQVVFHGIVANKKMHSIYNPGLAAVMLLHMPIAAAYFWYGQANRLFSERDWLFSVGYLAAFMVLFGLTNRLAPNENSPIRSRPTSCSGSACRPSLSA